MNREAKMLLPSNPNRATKMNLETQEINGKNSQIENVLGPGTWGIPPQRQGSSHAFSIPKRAALFFLEKLM